MLLSSSPAELKSLPLQSGDRRSVLLLLRAKEGISSETLPHLWEENSPYFQGAVFTCRKSDFPETLRSICLEHCDPHCLVTQSTH